MIPPAAALLAATPGWPARAAAAGLDEADAAAILDAAGVLADGVLAPLAARADREGCRLVAGRVVMPEGAGAAYARLGAEGWIAPDLPAALGGCDLPLTLQSAASLAFEGAAAPLMMAAGASRAGAHLLAGIAPEIAADWAPRLAAGDWTATICISEPDAGSDLGRIRTRATPDAGGWRVTGTKCWISFGDHDMAARIGHLLLARTGPAEAGTRGLSLFLVANDDPATLAVERIEDKAGLHGSPTCVLRFEGAQATLLGVEGRGLPQLFDMISRMRLQTACQGAGIARHAAALARRYASERRQGGPADTPPPPIASHPDVRRQLAEIEVTATLLTALVLDLATRIEDGQDALAGFLLPLAKTFGGEGAQQAASGAMQVLGGAGYTREHAAERLWRDARILTIYEGTTGMQAQDLLLRRLRGDDGRAVAAFLAAARAELADAPTDAAATARAVLDDFEHLSGSLATRPAGPGLLLAADGYLRAGWCAAEAWLAARLVTLGGEAARLGRFRLASAPGRFALARAATGLDPDLIGEDRPG